MSKQTVFWSWQSDLPGSTHRDFIRTALDEAIESVTATLNVSEARREIEIDSATKGAAGMVDISNAIFEKIQNAAVFVADLTPVSVLEIDEKNGTQRRKSLPNPNVLLETGWAMAHVGWPRMIGVMNTATNGTAETLPFDLRGRRCMSYYLPADAGKAERRKARRRLAQELEAALRASIQTHAEALVEYMEFNRASAKSDDPSIWASANSRVHLHPEGLGQKREIEMPPCPRAYLRLTPASWHNNPPRMSEVGGGLIAMGSTA